MRAAVLTIGDEIVAGFSIDTNSVWLAQELLKRGISVAAKKSVGDDLEAILETLTEWDSKFDLVITTGGLGPTHDDITKTAFCRYFESDIKFDKDYWNLLVERFRKRGYEIPANNRSQAEIPVKAVTVPNPVGSALGLKFTSPATSFYVLPGVPREMKAIMTEHLLPELGSGEAVSVVTLRTTGIIESALADRLKSFVAKLDRLQIAYLPAYTGVDLRLRGLDKGMRGKEQVESAVAMIEAHLGDLVYGRDDDKLEAVVGRMLMERQQTLAIAESCSGGLASSRITDIPGSSDYLLGAVVAYHNESKVTVLNVNPDTLEKYGAVSESTAIEMAEGVRTVFGAQWGIATTGISGPSGGTSEKPVGLVYLAVAGPQRTVARKANLVPHRLPHKAATAQAALNLLRLEIRHGS